jgi:uncharacterized protein YrrD
MLQSVMQDLKGDSIVARDGVIGSVKDVYFDDQRWAVRYLVVDTGHWLPGRKVLISPASVSSQGAQEAAIHVDLTRAEVERAPGIGQDPPISRLLEAAHADHYRYPYYWSGPYLWGIVPVPYHGGQAEGRVSREMRRMAEQQAAESHLRSSAEVVGYTIRADDGDIGHVEDLLVDEKSWAITDIVVDTRNWLPGKKVLVPPVAIEAVDWHSQQVNVRFTRDALKRA